MTSIQRCILYQMVVRRLTIARGRGSARSMSLEKAFYHGIKITNYILEAIGEKLTDGDLRSMRIID